MSKHPGVRYAVEVYFCSDSTGFEGCIRVACQKPLPDVQAAIDPATLLGQFGHKLPDAAPDWRFMTDEEIEEYRAAL